MTTNETQRKQPLMWTSPLSFDPNLAGLGFPPLPGVEHSLIYDPVPSACNLDEGGNGEYESLKHGTYCHHTKIVLAENKFIVTWTHHSRDENGPGQRILAKVGTFDDKQESIYWGGDETLVELAPAPVPVRRRNQKHDAEEIYEPYAEGKLVLINGRLYLIGELVACHGWTDDCCYHGMPEAPVPSEHWRDALDFKSGFKYDMWWRLGLGFAQRWRIDGATLVPDSPMYQRTQFRSRVEVCPGRFKRVTPIMPPYVHARPVAEATTEFQADVKQVSGHPRCGQPAYAPGTWRLAADGHDGLAHFAEFRRPDGTWVVIRDNLENRGFYYAASKPRREDVYPKAVQTNLFGGAMPAAGELPDGRSWILCNTESRFDFFLTLSDDGFTFDRTWEILHIERESDGGMCKGGGPQYPQAVTVGDNIWLAYSITKEKEGVTRIPLSALPHT